MKILCIADEEVKAYWDYYDPGTFPKVDLIISCGDLDPDYLSFLATMTNLPVLYVRGNHDDKYAVRPPEGCVCIEDDIYVHEGLRIMGLGGCMRYNRGINQYTEQEMRRRIIRMQFKIWRRGGIDLLVSHAPARGVGDAEDLCHRGFEAFHPLIRTQKPKYFVHGHMHLSYGYAIPRENRIGDTKVVNAYESYLIDLVEGC